MTPTTHGHGLRPAPERTIRIVLLALVALLLAPATARAHGATGGMSGGPGSGGPMGSGHTGKAAGGEMPVVKVQVPSRAQLGSTITIRATLTDPHDGMPIPHMPVTFEAPAYWGEEMQGMMVIGSAETDRSGVATITSQLRSSRTVEITATVAGSRAFAPAEGHGSVNVVGGRQLYSSTAGIKVPWLNLWVLAAVIAFVWSFYFIVWLRVVAIWRSGRSSAVEERGAPEAVLETATRRQFLGRYLPIGVQAGIASMGLFLVGVVARSPRTHGNLMAPPSTMSYHRTPVAHVGPVSGSRPMPKPLERTVSFSREVLPILLANGGPHVVAPRNSPPPGDLQMDSYEHLMAREGAVVPGMPDDSELVGHVLSVGMQMPPSLPPIPMERVQLIVSWIAQGAKNN